MRDAPSFFSSKRVLFSAVALALVVAGSVWHFTRRARHAANPQLASPALALAALSAKSLYYNGPALPWLIAQRADLLVEEDKAANSERTRGFAQAVLNPKLFRQLDRRWRFDTLLFVGDPSQYRPLLEHILEAKDWTLAYVDHAALVYKREGTREWMAGDLAAVEAHFTEPADHALFLAQTAGKLLAVRRNAEAKTLLDAAQKLDDGLPDVWNGMATHRMLRGEWQPALTAVDRALALDADFLPAIATKTQILFSTKKFSAAYDLSNQLIEKLPDDPGLLFYHAKICHQAHAYTAEIRTLKKLIERAEAESRPVAGYRIYLAQAHAAAGDAQPAAEEFRRVLADPDLSTQQRDFAEQTLAQIVQRAGLK